MVTRTVRLAWAVVDEDVSVVVTGEHTARIVITTTNTCSECFITGSNALGRKVMPAESTTIIHYYPRLLAIPILDLTRPLRSLLANTIRRNK